MTDSLPPGATPPAPPPAGTTPDEKSAAKTGKAKPRGKGGKRGTARKPSGAPQAEVVAVIKYLGGEKAKGRLLLLYEQLAHNTILVRAMSKEQGKHTGENAWLRLYNETRERGLELSDAIQAAEAAAPGGSSPPPRPVGNAEKTGEEGGGTAPQSTDEPSGATEQGDSMLQ